MSAAVAPPSALVEGVWAVGVALPGRVVGGGSLAWREISMGAVP